MPLLIINRKSRKECLTAGKGITGVMVQTDVGDAGLQNHQHSLSRSFAGNTQHRRHLLAMVNVFNFGGGRPAKAEMYKIMASLLPVAVGRRPDGSH